MIQKTPRLSLLFVLTLASCSNNDKAKLFGERAYSAWPLLNPDNDDIPGLVGNNFAWKSSTAYHNISSLAYALKVRSDAICDRYKVDLTLQQTGTSFLADMFSVLIAPIGAVAGGVTGQAVSAAQGAATGTKNTISSDIYQQVTGIVANYIDVGRDQQWTTIEKNLAGHVYDPYVIGNEVVTTTKDSNNKDVTRIEYRGYNPRLFDDIQTYHNACSLGAALKTAESQSGTAADKAKKDKATAAAPAAAPGGVAATPGSAASGRPNKGPRSPGAH
jgi:hypothetical protein